MWQNGGEMWAKYLSEEKRTLAHEQSKSVWREQELVTRGLLGQIERKGFNPRLQKKIVDPAMGSLGLLQKNSI